MKRIAIAAALALAAVLSGAPAQAQALRTFVSTTGLDTNPCSITQPCRHFQAAVDATAVGGEVDALDAGSYSPITISHAITINGQGWSYLAPPTGLAAITITAVSGNVTISGVSINGVGVTGQTTGILFNSGGSLIVRDSVIQNCVGNGISFTPNAFGSPKFYASNTLLSDNGDGIFINLGGVASGKVVLEHVEMTNNTSHGLSAATDEAATIIIVSDSVSSNNGGNGIYITNAYNNAVSLNVRNSTIFNNAIGLDAEGDLATIRVTRSTIMGNATGWAATGSPPGGPGVVLSYGDNNIDDNGSANTEPPNPLSYK